MVRAAFALLAIASLSACVPRFGTPADMRSQELAVGAARFRVQYWRGDDREARRVIRILETAVPRVQRWGDLQQPVTITIYPSHEALEAAVDRPGYGWLKAWARYQTIDIQSPRTWSVFGGGDRKLAELVTHELTHCAMYQEAGDDLNWMYKEIPIWFSEGIASVSGGGGHRHGGPESLVEYYREKMPGSGGGLPGPVWSPRATVVIAGDPIIDPAPIYQDQSDLVYAAAFHAAKFLIDRYGEQKVHRILELMGTGMRFPAAFKEAIGISDAEFASDFRRYVVWQGWRR